MKKVALFLLQSLVLYLAIKIAQRVQWNQPSQERSKLSPGMNQSNDSLANEYRYTVEKQNGSSLGRHTWAVLHSLAAAYPNKPNSTEMGTFESFFNGFINFYPCSQKEFKEIVKSNPLEHGSREELVYYICELHNLVNAKAKKPKFNCRHAFDIWGGDCGCDS